MDGFIFETLSPNSGTHSTDLETLMQLPLLAFRRKPTEAASSALGSWSVTFELF